MSDFSSAPHDSTASVNEGLLMFNEMGIRPSSKLNDRYGSAQQFQQAISELKRMLSSPDSVTTDSDQLSAHGHSFYDCHPTLPPSVVVFPRSTGDVVAIVKIANKYKMPVIPYSGATSLDGQFRATSVGGISVDMSKMNKILEVHASDSDLVCQPGAKWVMINESLKTDGIPLFFPLDPGLGANIGGMITTGCSGSNAMRYGTAKEDGSSTLLSSFQTEKCLKRGVALANVQPDLTLRSCSLVLKARSELSLKQRSVLA